MWHKFLSALATYLEMKTGPSDVTRYLRLGAAIAKAGKTVNEQLAIATAKVEQLVAEDRGLTDEENAALDASIESKLAAIADVDVGAGGTDPT